MGDKLDIIVFGATGFTGKYTLPFVYKFAKSEGHDLTWGIAGRSENKLKAVLEEAGKKIDVKLDVPIIIADVNDEESVKAMARQAKVIINCCGPYLLYGEVVVKACVENGTHVLDITGEIQFIENMRLKYHKAAEESGSYIVSACGFDSVPSDLGVVYLENNFEGTLNSAEVFLSAADKNGLFSSGPLINFGTYQSVVLLLGKIMEKASIQQKLNLTPLPDLKPKLSWRLPLPSNNPTKSWILPFIGADVDIMKNSQRYFYDNDKKRRPIQTNIYVCLGNLFIALVLMLVAPIFILLCQFDFSRNILLKYPQLFTLGYISHENPSEEKLEKTVCKFWYYGEGWKEKLSEGSDQYSSQPNKSIVAQMSAKNPGYGFTALAITLCSFLILTEKDKMPKKGGVYTTAAAFSKTSLIEQLQKNDVKFEIVSVNDL